jgi:hypothetical protein|tara:strand:- start:1798 stop:2775 length:978 start_codon:yes stop_codon:yes gene_type:complete
VSTGKTELVTAHTPDDTAYHPGLNAYGTTIPRANKEGGSRGFDPHKPGVVIVDPDMEDGNLEVDFSKFGEIADFNNKIQRAVGDSPNADSAFKAYSDIAGELTGSKDETSSSAPSSSTPKKEPNSVNRPKLRKPTPLVRTAPVMQETTQGNEHELQTQAALAEQAEMIRQLSSELSKLREVREVVPPAAPPVAEAIPPVEDEPEEEVGVDLAQDHLGMPFLGLSAPLKPQKEIYFEMPQAGTMGARYHEVIEGGNCIALVYDTRYEEGYQWIPPSLGDSKIKMTLPRENKTYTCSSVGIQFHIGVLDVVVLFKHDDDEDVVKENY